MRHAKLATLAGVLLALLGSVAGARADDYPSRPVAMVVPNPPGGPTDTLARIVADGMRGPLGQPLIIETITGAGGTVAGGHVARATPDGYTIEVGNWSSHVGAAAIYAVEYDVQKDLQPIALLAYAPLWIVGRNGLPPKTVTELIAWLKTNPSTFATIGAGSAAHVCGIFFAQKTGAQFQYVPYRGAGPVIQDLLAGHIDLSCLDGSATLATVQSGGFRAYAMMTDKRWPRSPDTPTMSESGAPGLTIAFWEAMWAPRGMPQPVIDRLVAAVNGSLADPKVRARLDAIGQIPFPPEQQNPQALAAFHKAEIDKWWPIIKAAGIKGE
jgi:tripartite-type tricarboxylate transporter receptor subunit TctC